MCLLCPFRALPPKRTPTFSPRCFNPQLQIQQLPPTSRAKIVAVFSLAWCRGIDWQLGQTMSLSWLLSQANLCLLGLWYQVTFHRGGGFHQRSFPCSHQLSDSCGLNSLMITKGRRSARNPRVIPYLLNFTCRVDEYELSQPKEQWTFSPAIKNSRSTYETRMIDR